MSQDNCKTCTKCKVEKPILDFPKRNNRSHGFQPYCKQCHRNLSKAHRAAKKAGVKAIPERETGVYVWTYADGTPIYVGITSDLASRTSTHKSDRTSRKWSRYAVAPTEFTLVFGTRAEALAAEEAMIKTFVDLGFNLVNKTHNIKNSTEHYKAVIKMAKVMSKQYK